MENIYAKIHESVASIRSVTSSKPTIGIVLGTGLGHFSETLENAITLPYKDIPHFPVSTVESHKGALIIGKKYDRQIAIMAGRFHYYEGYSAKEITFPVRVLKAIGVKNLIITNVSGGVNPHFEAGDIIAVNDHINLMPDHPLRGINDDRLGIRFPDMSDAYNADLIAMVKDVAEVNQIPLKEGVYLSLQGPSLETRAEYRMVYRLGADLVGMSTVPEVIVANHAGLKVLVLSVVSNKCFPTSAITETTIEEVTQVAAIATPKLEILLDNMIKKLND